MPVLSLTTRAVNALGALGTHAKARWGVSRSTLMHTVLLGAPLVLVVTVLRLLEFSFLLEYQHPSAGRILQTHLPYLLLVLLAPAFVFAWMRIRWSRTSVVWHIGIATGIGAALGKDRNALRHASCSCPAPGRVAQPRTGLLAGKVRYYAGTPGREACRDGDGRGDGAGRGEVSASDW